MHEKKAMKVLFIDDDVLIQEQMKRFLEYRFRGVIVAKNGKEGLNLYLSEHPDIIITDIQMPIMDGYALIKEVRKRNPEIPLVVMTAFNDKETIHLLKELGMTNMVAKPFRRDAFLAVLEEVTSKVSVATW